MTLTKLSLLWFFHRIFPSDSLRIVWIVMAIFSVLWCVGSTSAMIFACWPIRAFWDRAIAGRCVDLKVLMYGITAPNLALDLMLLVLPLIPLWGLRLDKARKIALISIFMLGGLYVLLSRRGSVWSSGLFQISADRRAVFASRPSSASPTSATYSSGTPRGRSRISGFG